MTSDSPSATTPRMIGSRIQRCRVAALEMGRQTRARPPSARRTVTAHVPGLRIITPSSTAWPPTFALMGPPSYHGSSACGGPFLSVYADADFA